MGATSGAAAGATAGAGTAEQPDGAGARTAGEAERGAVAAAAVRSEESEAETSTAVATAGAGSPPDAAGTALPHGRPKKPMLAAAGILGAVLIAVPFLLMGGGEDEDKRQNVSRESADTMLGAGAAGDVPDGYATERPSPSPSKKPSKEPKSAKEPTASPSQPTLKPVAPAPAAGAAKKKAEPKSSPRSVSPAAARRAAANAASNASNVLLKNVTTGMCADTPGEGPAKNQQRVNQHTCFDETAADNQVWNLQVRSEDGPQGASLFRISNAKGGLCMDLAGYKAQPAGTTVRHAPCNPDDDGDNQLWWLDPRADGSYWIRNFASGGLCLDVSGFATGGMDTKLTVYNCNDSTTADDHHWRIKST